MPGQNAARIVPAFQLCAVQGTRTLSLGLEILVLERGEKSEMFGLRESEPAQPAVTRGGARPRVLDRGAPLGSILDFASIGASDGSASGPVEI